MSVITPANLILYTDIPLLNQYRQIPPPNTDVIIASIKEALTNGESVYPIYIDVLCGQSNFITHAFTTLEHELKDVALIYKVQCYDHFISYENVFLDEILTQLGHAFHNIGTQHARLDRLVKYLSYLCVLESKESIVVLMNEAQNLKNNDYKILAALTAQLKEQEIQLLLLFVGDTSILEDTFAPNSFMDYGIVPSNGIRIGAITTKNELMYVLSYYDDLCTNTFFHIAYENGSRLVDDVESLSSAIEAASIGQSVSSVPSIPLDTLIQAIEACLKIYGSMGEQQYWPSKEYWIQSLSCTGYSSYIQKI